MPHELRSSLHRHRFILFATRPITGGSGARRRLAVHAKPVATNHIHPFSIDDELLYEPFFADFGARFVTSLRRRSTSTQLISL